MSLSSVADLGPTTEFPGVALITGAAGSGERNPDCDDMDSRELISFTRHRSGGCEVLHPRWMQMCCHHGHQQGEA